MSYSKDDAASDSCLLMSTCLMPNIEDNGGVLGQNDPELDEALEEYYAHLQRVKVASHVSWESRELSSSLFEGGSHGQENQKMSQGNYDDSMLIFKHGDVDFGALPSREQAQRDVERDRFIINGAYISGAELGFSSLLSHIVSLITTTTTSTTNTNGSTTSMQNDHGTSSELESPLVHKVEEISEMVLIRSSRTLSGGASYAALASNIGEMEQPIPVSTLASPVGLRIGIDATPHGIISMTGKDKEPASVLSLSVDIDASTVFQIKQFDDGDMNDAKEETLILVTYKDRMLIPLSFLVQAQQIESIRSTGDDGNDIDSTESMKVILGSRELARVSVTPHPSIKSATPPYFSSSSSRSQKKE